MKIYISADIEGVTGVTHTHEATKTETDYSEFREQMTNEVLAACKGAQNSGAKEIYIKDAHSTGRNIIAHKLPECIKLIRGWGRNPYGMLQELDDSFDAIIMIGYHSRAGSDTSPLSHTFNDNISQIKVNNNFASEFLINAYTAALVKVPIVFVSGDEGICQEVISLNKHINTVAVKIGVGGSTISIHPELALKKIEEGVNNILRSNISKIRIELPQHFRTEIEFRRHDSALRASFFPGVNRIGPKSILFETHDYFEVLRMIMFVV